MCLFVVCLCFVVVFSIVPHSATSSVSVYSYTESDLTFVFRVFILPHSATTSMSIYSTSQL